MNNKTVIILSALVVVVVVAAAAVYFIGSDDGEEKETVKGELGTWDPFSENSDSVTTLNTTGVGPRTSVSDGLLPFEKGKIQIMGSEWLKKNLDDALVSDIGKRLLAEEILGVQGDYRGAFGQFLEGRMYGFDESANIHVVKYDAERNSVDCYSGTSETLEIAVDHISEWNAFDFGNEKSTRGLKFSMSATVDRTSVDGNRMYMTDSYFVGKEGNYTSCVGKSNLIAMTSGDVMKSIRLLNNIVPEKIGNQESGLMDYSSGKTLDNGTTMVSQNGVEWTYKTMYSEVVNNSFAGDNRIDLTFLFDPEVSEHETNFLIAPGYQIALPSEGRTIGNSSETVVYTLEFDKGDVVKSYDITLETKL